MFTLGIPPAKDVYFLSLSRKSFTGGGGFSASTLTAAVVYVPCIAANADGLIEKRLIVGGGTDQLGLHVGLLEVLGERDAG